MADYVTPEGTRSTRTRDDGHQIRLKTAARPGLGTVVTVGCRCTRAAVVSRCGVEDHWRLYDALPHDPAAGQFVPVDEGDGRARGLELST